MILLKTFGRMYTSTVEVNWLGIERNRKTSVTTVFCMSNGSMDTNLLKK